MLLNLDRAFKMMEKYDIDALVAATPENNFYLSGVWSISHSAIRGVNVFTVLPKQGNPMLVLPQSELDQYAESYSWIKNIKVYGTFYVEDSEDPKRPLDFEETLSRLVKVRSERNAIETITNVFFEQGLERAKIGVDELGISFSLWLELQSKLPKATIVPASHIFKEIRMVKTDEEISRLKKAAEISEGAFYAAVEQVHEGVTELDVAREFDKYVIENGGVPFLTLFGFGARSTLPNCVPTNNKLKKGDVIRFDGGCIYQHYYSDIAFSAVFGQPTEKMRRYYRALVMGTQKAIQSIKPGVMASELFRIAVNTVKENGVSHYKRHHCGHGIGVEIYDLPTLSPSDNRFLEEGMVLCVETPYYEICFGGLQIEKTVLVTKDGFEYLTSPIENEELLVIK
ncbi:MAG: Xaa-Pro peptidase family protein [Candidatus Bathyarchaeia archaeon]